jgi:hypothetical protein
MKYISFFRDQSKPMKSVGCVRFRTHRHLSSPIDPWQINVPSRPYPVAIRYHIISFLRNAENSGKAKRGLFPQTMLDRSLRELNTNENIYRAQNEGHRPLWSFTERDILDGGFSLDIRKAFLSCDIAQTHPTACNSTAGAFKSERTLRLRLRRIDIQITLPRKGSTEGR